MAPIDPKLMRRVPSLRRGLTVTGAFAVATAGAIVAQAAALSFALVSGVRGELDVTALTIAALAFAVRALLACGQQTSSSRNAAAVKEQLRRQVLQATGNRKPLWSKRAGEAVTLITRGVEGLDAYITGYLPQVCLSATVPLTILVVLAFNDWASLLIIAITLPLIPIFGVLVGWHTKAKTEKQWRTLSRLGGHFLDAVAGLSTLRIFGRAAKAAEAVTETADRYRNATMATLRVAFLSALVLELVATLSVALVAVPIGLRLLDGAMDLRTAFLILLLAPEVYLPLRSVGTQFHAAAEGMAATKEAIALVDESGESYPQSDGCPQAPRPELDSECVEPHRLKSGEEAGGPKGIDEIQFDALTVAYPDRDRPAIDGVSAVIPAGETIALLGPSGAGKTTILNVLLGFVAPSAGQVHWGRSTLDDGHWRRHIAWVPQRPHLFAMSLADNIRLGQPDVGPERVAEAARHARAAEFIDELPHRYDTMLGQNGFGLSAGQARRIALARAFLRLQQLDCPLVLLDEPTASLDATSEALVAEATAALLRGRTAVVVAHRPALLDSATQIWHLDAGRLTQGART
ncbi:MAG: thiol reductant ABC exporter subunit CydD [Stackebrandtia sp.]